MNHNNFLPHFHYNKDWNWIIRQIPCPQKNFLPHFHYNKDWNIVWRGTQTDKKETSYPTSIITRIETINFHSKNNARVRFLPHFHYNKDWNFSDKAREWLSLAIFLPHFHYNKDWNRRLDEVNNYRPTSYPTSIITRIETWKWKSYGGCYCSSYPTSIITRIETYASCVHSLVSFDFLPHFHYNKDWNVVSRLQCSLIHRTSYPTSIITRIETSQEARLAVFDSILLTPLPL